MREVDPNWMDVDVTVPDLVEDDDAVLMARVTTVELLTVAAEVDCKEKTVQGG